MPARRRFAIGSLAAWIWPAEQPSGRWIAARVALEEGKTTEAIEHLRIMQAGIGEVQQVLAMFQALAGMYPENAESKAYMESRVAELRDGTAGGLPRSPPPCVPLREIRKCL